ncbi:PH domain-containing protein [Populibacterium corticicola]|uniref:PH domain-containing protein n=1 Tax=Populibacterium corticicola TaxID=1812826 RepID=UPI00366B5EFA
MGPTEIFRPLFSRVLAYIVWAILAAAAISGFFAGNSELRWRVVALTVFLAVAVWLFYLRPSVEISDGGILITNPLRSVHIPWPAVAELDIRGTFVVTDREGNRHSAYAAAIANKRNNLGLAGEVKTFAEHRMNTLAEAGFLSNVRPEGAQLTTRHNTVGITALTVCALVFVITLSV